MYSGLKMRSRLYCSENLNSRHTNSPLGVRFDRESVTKMVADDSLAGPHAQNYLETTWFMHTRLQEYAHLPASTADPDAFHFGTSVFASKEELKYFLTQIWQQPIDDEKPELGFRPIVCLEYGNGSGSVSAAMWKEIGFDPAKMDNTIAMLDGQVIAEQAKITRNQFATIDYLLAQFQISPHACDHAGNTAAYVIIVAMLCALRKHLYQSTQNEKSKPGQHGQSTSVAAQVVVNRLMERPTPAPPTGVEIYCHRCGSHEHKFRQCINTDFICNGCLLSPVSWKRDNAASHKEGLCIFRPRFFH